MTPQELKNSILQLAIQGKLVEQRPEEGTAEELYKQIQIEKQALVKAGKIKKEKPLPEITEDEKPFDIPESWMWVRLRDIVFSRGQKIPTETFSYIDIGSIDNKRQCLNQVETLIEPEKAPSRARKLVELGDIIYSTVRPYLHNMCIIDRIFSHKPIASTGFAAMACYNGLFNKYLFYFLLSPTFDSYANNVENSKGVAYPAINDDRLYRAVVAFPPLAEQKRIVAKIEELLPLIDRYEKAWSRLEDFNTRFPGDMQKSLLQMAIQGKLVEQRPEEGTGEELYQQIQKEKQALVKAGKIKKDKPLPEIKEDEIPFDIPESWKWVRLVELGTFSSGKTPTMGESKYWSNGTVQWFTSKDMKKKYLDSSEMQITELAASEMTKYPAGTLLMVVRSGILKRMLPLCILTQESTINQDIKAFRLFDFSISEYVYYMIKGLETHILENYRKQVTTVDSIKFDEFSKEMPVPLPPLAEQKRIVAQLNELLPLCERLK